MKTIKDIQNFLDAFTAWASIQRDIQAVALVGSYARQAARNDSDIDLVILTDQFPKYIEDARWIELFGMVEKVQTEDYGNLTSVRVWYRNGPEVEYGLTVSAPPNHTLPFVQPSLSVDYLMKAKSRRNNYHKAYGLSSITY